MTSSTIKKTSTQGDTMLSSSKVCSDSNPHTKLWSGGSLSVVCLRSTDTTDPGISMQQLTGSLWWVRYRSLTFGSLTLFKNSWSTTAVGSQFLHKQPKNTTKMHTRAILTVFRMKFTLLISLQNPWCRTIWLTLLITSVTLSLSICSTNSTRRMSHVQSSSTG